MSAQTAMLTTALREHRAAPDERKRLTEQECRQWARQALADLHTYTGASATVKALRQVMPRECSPLDYLLAEECLLALLAGERVHANGLDR